MALNLKLIPNFLVPIFLPPFSKSIILSSLHRYNKDHYSLISLSNDHIANSKYFRISYRRYMDDDEDEQEKYTFDEAVILFNQREYYKCHDVLEALWMKADEPNRTLFHGILQCAVGLHHLFNQNHKGAMMELGEGLCKLKKMNFENGPFHQFEYEISATLEFIYQTQIELAACINDYCLTMDRSERSYQLLGEYAPAQHLYSLDNDPQGVTHIIFCPKTYYSSDEPPKVKLPILNASREHIPENVHF